MEFALFDKSNQQVDIISLLVIKKLNWLFIARQYNKYPIHVCWLQYVISSFFFILVKTNLVSLWTFKLSSPFNESMNDPLNPRSTTKNTAVNWMKSWVIILQRIWAYAPVCLYKISNQMLLYQEHSCKLVKVVSNNPPENLHKRTCFSNTISNHMLL